MFLDSAKKKEIFEKYGKSATNTGSAESQIALFTVRIAHLTEHLKANHKDHSSERALKVRNNFFARSSKGWSPRGSSFFLLPNTFV